MKKNKDILKKTRCLIYVCIVIILLSFTSCETFSEGLYRFTYGIPMDWPEVEIESFGSICLPEEWNVSIIDGFIYISSVENGESKYVLIQAYASKEQNELGRNEYFADIENSEILRGEIFSTSVYMSKNVVYYKDGTSNKMFLLQFPGNEWSDNAYFYCVDNSVSESTLRKIANSYHRASSD